MDGLSLAASIVAIIQLTGACLKLGKKFLGPSIHSSSDLKAISMNLYGLNGTLKNLETYLAVNEDDHIRLQALDHLEEPFKDCAKAVKVVEEKLRKTGSLGNTIMGASFDDTLKKSLKMIEESRKLFEMALQSDQQILLKAIETYTRNIAEDVRDNAKLLRSLDDRIQESEKERQIWYNKQKKRDISRENQRIVEWLSPLNFWIKQQDVLSMRSEGTGSWLTETKEFRDWLDNTKRRLWCPGIPGAGKTVLASIVVDHLNQIFKYDNVAIACIYFNYKEEGTHSPEGLMGNILKQLLQNDIDVPGELRTLYESHYKKQTRPSLSELFNVFGVIAQGCSKVFIVIDALDECSQSNGVRRGFLGQMRKIQENVHLFCTSRHIKSIESEFFTEERLEIHARDEDVRRYVETRILEENKLVRHIEEDRTLREEIISTIVKKAKGMFLLARLYMDSLARKHNHLQVQEALKTLPEEINDVYNEAMDRISDQDEEDSQLAKKVLSWISFARRPLPLIELQTALAIQSGSPALNESVFIKEDFLVSVCGGLVTVDQQSGIVGLIHYTTQEYFEKTRNTRLPDAHSELAKVCLTCLLHQMPPDTSNKNSGTPFSNTLLHYACTNWGHHVREGWTRTIENSALMFLGQESKVNDVMQFAQLPFWWRPRALSATKGAALWAAIYFDLDKIIRLLLKNGADIDARFWHTNQLDPEAGITGLQYAALFGKQAMAQLLIENGANVNARVSSCSFCIPDLDVSINGTALIYASRYGNVAIVQLLLQNGADIAAEDRCGSALHASALHNEQKVVQMLLDQGADINARSIESRQTPLHLAIVSGFGETHEQVTMVDFLLRRAADANLIGRYGITPVQLAVYEGRPKVLQLLLDWQTDKDLKGKEISMALHNAIKPGSHRLSQDKRMKILKFLLETGTDVDNMIDGLTPLHRAVRLCHKHWSSHQLAIARLLLDNGADVDRVTDEGKTALCLARERDDIPMEEKNRHKKPI